ncbi:hypothetical protein BS50DRAFT_412689 [Corynespora cassiicola Philippines]|uniref:Uncharacterized protein n=1 Tax=Corynespora cassiicola Philippines TaxID=1448308 RepID=A0A2T2NLM9_CORCC|nr:hypothetical protein BS50DRAFT_412689 [Corynespora cassiicola Philippines]
MPFPPMRFLIRTARFCRPVGLNIGFINHALFQMLMTDVRLHGLTALLKLLSC